MTVGEAARLFGYTTSHLHRLVREGALPLAIPAEAGLGRYVLLSDVAHATTRKPA